MQGMTCPLWLNCYKHVLDIFLSFQQIRLILKADMKERNDSRVGYKHWGKIFPGIRETWSLESPKHKGIRRLELWKNSEWKTGMWDPYISLDCQRARSFYKIWVRKKYLSAKKVQRKHNNFFHNFEWKNTNKNIL